MKADNAKYEKTASGMEYIIYPSPVIVEREDIVLNYVEGGVILYKAGKNRNELRILAHVKYNEEITKHPIAGVSWVKKAPEFAKLSPYRVEFIYPTKETDITLSDPIVMSEEQFFSNENDYVNYVVDTCKKVFDINDDQLRFYVHYDIRNGGIMVFGYSVKELPESYFKDSIIEVTSMTYEDYKERQKCHEKRKENKERIEQEFKAHKEKAVGNKKRANSDEKQKQERANQDAVDLDLNDEMDEFFEMDEFLIDLDYLTELDSKEDNSKNSSVPQKHLPRIAYKIRKWLKDTDFNAFCKAITDRVKGQEEAELVAINVYNYLECVAYGKRHNNNILMAAPSGCGKTETFRAIRDYFEEAIPNLVIYQLDMTSITEEGFKGKDTNFLISPLKACDEGVGIAFLDEFDKKLIPSFSGGGSNVNLAVQMQILTLIEGRKCHDVSDIDTSNTMFIGMGAFDICRSNKSIGEKHIGFGMENKPGESHYAKISREDMIELGACYELIGRFSSIINYHELSLNIIDEIIDGMVSKVSDDIGCRVIISETVRGYIHENANGKYGCRIIDSIIRENAMKGYLLLRKDNKNPKECEIKIEEIGNVVYKALRKSTKKKATNPKPDMEAEAS